MQESVNIKSVKDLVGYYFFNKAWGKGVEEIYHIVDRENDFKWLRINGTYHNFDDLVFLKKINEDNFSIISIGVIKND